MIYKGFEIKAVYYPGSDFYVTEDGRVINRIPKSKDIAYYEIIDPNDDSRYAAESSIGECKTEINRLLKIMGMKDNTEKSWQKIEGYYPGFHTDWRAKQNEFVRGLR